MARSSSKLKHRSVMNGSGRKSSSIGNGGRGRTTKIAMSTMNKSKKRSHKAYRGQGR